MSKKSNSNTKSQPTGRPKNIPGNDNGEVRGQVPRMKNPPPPPPKKRD